MFLDYPATCFLKIGCEMMGWRSSPMLSTTTHRRFWSAFGLTANLCKCLWNLIGEIADQTSLVQARPKHLLWALFFLKQYSSSEINSGISGSDEKTFRKWSWCFVKLISELNLVSTILNVCIIIYLIIIINKHSVLHNRLYGRTGI